MENLLRREREAHVELRWVLLSIASADVTICAGDDEPRRDKVHGVDSIVHIDGSDLLLLPRAVASK